MPDEILFYNECALPCPLNVDRIQTIVRMTLLPENQRKEIVITCLNEKEIQALNQNYRHHNKPTNVLSFPYEGLDSFTLNPEISHEPPLGDIILCPTVIEREAKEQSKTFADHFTHLLIHGTLHLQGFDHETTAEAELMESREIQLLKSMGINNPYEEGGL